MTTEWANHALGEICDVRKGTAITEKATTLGDVPVIAGGIGPTYPLHREQRPGRHHSQRVRGKRWVRQPLGHSDLRFGLHDRRTY